MEVYLLYNEIRVHIFKLALVQSESSLVAQVIRIMIEDKRRTRRSAAFKICETS